MPSFKETLDAMAAHQRLRPSQSRQLTDLVPEQMRQLQTVWSGLPDPERMHLLATLRRQAAEESLVDFNAIYEMALEDPNADVRRLAILASVDDESERLLNRLLQICLHDPDETVRAAAAERLGGFALKAELGELSEEDSREIERVLTDRAESETEATNVRAAALASVGYLSTEEVRTEIRRALARSGLHVAAIQAIGRNIDPIWSDTLREEMGSDDPSIRLAAAEAAADYESVVGDLADLVDDPDPSVRLTAIASLGKIGGTEARDALVYCAESTDPTIREAAANALQEIEEEEAPLDSFKPHVEE